MWNYGSLSVAYSAYWDLVLGTGSFGGCHGLGVYDKNKHELNMAMALQAQQSITKGDTQQLVKSTNHRPQTNIAWRVHNEVLNTAFFLYTVLYNICSTQSICKVGSFHFCYDAPT